MAFPLKKVIELSAAILKLTPLAPVGIAIGIGSEFFPDDDPNERSWKVKHIPEWKKLCAALMTIPMPDERKGSVLEGKMSSDFFSFYGEMPKQSHVQKWAAEIVMVVKAEAAATLPDQPEDS